MAEFRLRLPGFWTFQRRHANTVHVIGLDGIPWPCRVALEDDCLVIRRNRDESGKIYVAFPFEKRGEITVSTGTLPEREKPYELVTELARGTINRLRNQTSIWQEGGLEIPQEVQRLITESIRWLGRSILSSGRNDSSDQSLADNDENAGRAIETAMDAIFVLCDHFGKTIADFRVSQDELPPFWFAASVANGRQLQDADLKCFDLWHTSSELMLDTDTNRRRLIVGPILDASAGAPSAVDFETRSRAIRELLPNILGDLTEKTSLLHAVCGLNGIGHRQMSFQQQMQLTADILNTIDEAATETPVLVSFDFPWAERLVSSVGGTHPLQIADSLMRQGVRISFMGLEVNLDYWPAGSVSRDPLQWIDLIDIWSQLGLPLIFCLRIPQRATTQPNEERVAADQINDSNSKEQSDSVNNVRCNLSDDQRLEMLDTILPMIIARPGVHGIIWRQWQDSDDTRFPYGGLVDANGDTKAIMQQIAQIRSSVLKRD